MLSQWMDKAGFKRKQIMTNGQRSWYWVNNSIGKTGINAKIALKEFLKEYLKLMDSIRFDELTDILHKKGFDSTTYNNHFFISDEGQFEGMPKKWNGWILKGKLKEKIYTRLDSDVLTEQE
jgi:hypothetical protein